MPTGQVLQKNEAGIDEVSFAGTSHIETPVFSPEIKSYEDLFVLLRYSDALDDGAPIVVPSHTWRSIRSERKFKDYTSQIEDLVRGRPVIYREPVELYRYRRPLRLVSYGLADNSSSRTFYSRLRDGDIQGALDLLPKFHQPFVECQMERLLELKDIEVPSEYEGTLRSATEGWKDERANKEWPNYFASVVKDAQKSPDAGVVPPVPVITAGSSQNSINRARGANQGMVNTCRQVNEGHFGKPVYPYLHIYADYSVLKNTNENDRRIVDAIRQEIKDREDEASFTDIGNGGVSYQGVVLTISNLQNVWENNMAIRLERFVQQVEGVARQHDLPVIVPRSGWHGLYLTDLGVQTFSSLLNGNECYNQRGTGGISEEAKYGTTPFYGTAVDVGVSDAYQYLKNTGGSVHPISGLPDSPPKFDTSASTWEDRLGQDTEYREDFGKARRLLHAQEAREVRSAIGKGQSNPAKQYLRKSDHNDFS